MAQIPIPQQPDDNLNESLRKIIIDAYIYRDIKENVYNLTFQIEKLIRSRVIFSHDIRLPTLYNNRSNIFAFYNILTLEELRQLGF
jgi:hypothetical protein